MVQCRGIGEKEGWFPPFLHRLSMLECQDQEGLIPPPRMQETMDSMVGARHFSCMDLQSSFWQMKMLEKAHQYTAFTVGSMGV